MVKKKNIFQKIYLAVILIMLYLPIGVLIISSVIWLHRKTILFHLFILSLFSDFSNRIWTIYPA